MPGTRRTLRRLDAYSLISRKVIFGDNSASPPATTRTARISSAGSPSSAASSAPKPPDQDLIVGEHHADHGAHAIAVGLGAHRPGVDIAPTPVVVCGTLCTAVVD